AKKKWVIIIFASSLIFFAGIFSFLATPKYKSTSILLIEEEASRVLNINKTFGFQSQIVKDIRFFNTQLELLKSKSLAERVARKMDLISHPEFRKYTRQKKSFFTKIGNFITFKRTKSPKSGKGIRINHLISLNPYSEIVKVFQKSLKVKPILDTRLVEISFISTSPILASEVCNALAEEFISFSIEKRYQATKQASNFLSNQIVDLREDLAAKERELQKYGQEKNLFYLSDTESAALSKFADLNKACTQAQIDRTRAEADYRELKNLDIESITQSNNPIIQPLREEYTKIKNEYEEKSKIYKPGYPEMIKLKAKLDSMKEEFKKAVDAAESEYRAALKKEYSLKRMLDKQKADVTQMNSSAILYNSLKIEVENKRKLLDSLVEKQNETLVSEKLGSLKAGNISIIDRADVPKYPVSPKKKLNLFLAFLMGIFGGVGLCFVFEYLDNTVKGPEDVERLAELPSLGVIPYFVPDDVKKKSGFSRYLKHKYSYGAKNPASQEMPQGIREIELINHIYPKFTISEDYRTVRTSILLSNADTPPKAIAFSSALPREGKTTTVVNMAVSFAQLEEKVLVVDSDLRKPRLHRIFKTRNLGGLSGYLTGKIELKDAIQKTSVENIWILPSGPIPPNPAELLNSKKMKQMVEDLKKGFDVILFDTPPILAVIDSLIVSSIVDTSIIVINAGKLTRKPFVSAVEELKRAKAKIIGVIFNGFQVRKGDY
ncbi:MAG: GumC family protein, partial [Candidatus Helarchaeota archaeon]